MTPHSNLIFGNYYLRSNHQKRTGGKAKIDFRLAQNVILDQNKSHASQVFTQFQGFLQYITFEMMNTKFSNYHSSTASCAEQSPEFQLCQKMLSKNKYTYWSQKENNIYVSYIKTHKELMAEPKDKKRPRVFLQMSRLIKTRTPKQVKSHHQKLFKQHQSIDSIVDYFQNTFHTGSTTCRAQRQSQESLTKQQVQQNCFTENLFLDPFISQQWSSFLSLPGSKSSNDVAPCLLLIDEPDYTPQYFNYEEWENQF